MKKLLEDFSPPIAVREVMTVMCGTWYVHEDDAGWHLVRTVEEATRYEDFEKCMRLAMQVNKASSQVVRVVGVSTIGD